MAILISKTGVPYNDYEGYVERLREQHPEIEPTREAYEKGVVLADSIIIPEKA